MSAPFVTGAALAFVAGIVFTGWISKAPVAAKAPAPHVITFDSAVITNAVKAALPTVPAPVVTAAKAAPVVAAPVKAAKRKAKAKAAASRVISPAIYIVAPRCTCAV